MVMNKRKKKEMSQLFGSNFEGLQVDDSSARR